MREIKFRAWDKTNKKWLLGYDYGNLGGFSLVGECVLLGEYAALFHPLTRINEIELMQYTGLKDKNGKEIYEGYIVTSGGYEGSITYEDGVWWLGTTHLRDYVCEVIGNIHETPELLDK